MMSKDNTNQQPTQRAGDVLSFGPMIDSFVKLSSTCDKFLNCQYVSKQLDDESKEEKKGLSAVERVWSKMDHSLEVEIYRRFLFEENSPVPSFEDSDDFSAPRDMAHHSLTPPSTPPHISRQRS
jgi:hypothetical protein